MALTDPGLHLLPNSSRRRRNRGLLSWGRKLKTCLGIVLADRFGLPAFCQRLMCFYYICLCKKNAIYVVDALQGAMPVSRVRKGGCLKTFRHVLSRSHACRSHLLGTGCVHTTHFRRLDNIRGVFKTPLCHAPLNVS